MKITIECFDEHCCGLGEGPVWDHANGALWWIDSLAPRLFRRTLGAADSDSWALPASTVGSLAPREDGGLILAMDQGFYAFSPADVAIETIATPLAGRAHLRFNDGKVDPFGDFVAGGMNIDHREHDNCPMYRLSPGFEVVEVLDGFDCFNGPCFSADGDLMYASGRRDGVIEVFDYGPSRMPRNARALLEGCNPDGATVDAEGCIWSAQWDDACVLCITPDGAIDRRVEIPGQIVSSVMFGGPGLDLLFLTTVGAKVHGARANAPGAGQTLVIHGLGVRGRAEPVFGG